jgi:hypothetical protein
MRLCNECGRVNGHHAHCPNAEDCTEKEAVPMKRCDYCDTAIQDEDLRIAPDNLPDDIPWRESWDTMHSHRWCFEEQVKEWREELTP